MIKRRKGTHGEETNLGTSGTGAAAAPRQVNKSRDCVFVVIAAVSIGCTGVAFLPYALRLYKYPTFIHLHGVIMVGWLLLFLAQVLLAWRGYIRLHIRLGKASVYYVGLIDFVGVGTGYHQVARLAKAGLDLTEARVTFLGSIVHPLQFTILFAAGYKYKSNREIHRVLMTFANAALLPPSAGRFTLNYDLPRPVAALLLPLSIIFISLVYEYRVKGRVALALGCSVFNGLGVLTMLTVSQWPAFITFTEWALALDLMPWLGNSTFVFDSTTVWLP